MVIERRPNYITNFIDYYECADYNSSVKRSLLVQSLASPNILKSAQIAHHCNYHPWNGNGTGGLSMRLFAPTWDENHEI